MTVFTVRIGMRKSIKNEYTLFMHEHVSDSHHTHTHSHHHSHEEHGHSHGLVDESIIRSKAGVQAVSLSLVVLLLASLTQAVIFFSNNSVSLLVDLIHNFGDSLTALPLAAAFLLHSKRAEKYAGYFVVLTIFVSGCVAGVEAITRLLHPQPVGHILTLILAGIIGFAGNEIAAFIRMNAGKRLNSPALIADGAHARVDGLVSLSVVASGVLVWCGLPIADPLIGLIMTIVILRITWQSYKTITEVAG